MIEWEEMLRPEYQVCALMGLLNWCAFVPFLQVHFKKRDQLACRNV
jgi:hypothetical protein